LSEGGDGSSPPRLIDLFRPARLFTRLAERPRFLLPTLVLVAATVLYLQLAVGVTLPRILPAMLEHSTSTESGFARSFRTMLLALGTLAPWFLVALLALGSWATLRVTGPRIPYFPVLSLVAFASLWVALGLAAKAGLVLSTGTEDPPVNLTLLLEHPTRIQRVVLTFTNPFLVLAALWSALGLRAWGAGRTASLLAGAGPWILWIALIAARTGTSAWVKAPAGPVSTEGWLQTERPTLVMEYPPETEAAAERFATLLDEFTGRLGERFELSPQPIRVRVFAAHTDLERATGEFLHVKLTGSIRGRDLLFLELPGRSVALLETEGLHEALRYVALMHLPFAPGLDAAPRWFVEGISHAAAVPFSPRLEEEYRAALRRGGVPSFDALLDPATFRTPEGPLLARAVVDHLVFRHGADVLDLIRHDLAGGMDFRDALFARTRLTTSALEAEWQDAAVTVLRQAPPAPPPAVADSAAPGALSPFLRRQ
jgi:hypothetical protein